MKTPERWRALPRRALFASIFAQKSSKMSRRRAVTSIKFVMKNEDVKHITYILTQNGIAIPVHLKFFRV